MSVKYACSVGDADVAQVTLTKGYKGDVLPAALVRDAALEKKLVTTDLDGYMEAYNSSTSELSENPEDVKVEEVTFRTQGDYLYLDRPIKGRVFSSYQVLKMPNVAPKPIRAERRLMNRVNLIFTAANKVDRTTLVSALEFVNRELPNLDLIKETLPLVAYCLKESTLSEGFIKQVLSSRDTAVVNALKADGFKVTPTSFKEAWKAKRVLSYCALHLKSLIGLNDQIVVDPNSKDFRRLTKNF
jgi:hypothetical protein